jgi:enamine deaminase RidA (YjgF/YER057c/UK114 family)
MELEGVFSKARWEPIVGYCRAVRTGQHIYVTGTAPVDESESARTRPETPTRGRSRAVAIAPDPARRSG